MMVVQIEALEANSLLSASVFKLTALDRIADVVGILRGEEAGLNVVHHGDDSEFALEEEMVED